ncbi:MAG: alpha-amylase family glycosyl hydrolase [bacterium]
MSCFEFHISKKSRLRYQFNENIYCLSGNVVLTDFYAVRLFAQKINQRRDWTTGFMEPVRASHINAMGLIDEIIHYVCGRYRQDKNPSALKNAVNWLNDKFGAEIINCTLLKFIDEFPPLLVYQERQSKEAYLKAETNGISHSEILTEEMICLYLANNNPAFLSFAELFEDFELKKTTPYPQIVSSLIDYFNTQPRFGAKEECLIDFLRAPVKASPHSLTGQLAYIRENWAHLLSKDLLYRILLALDLIKEEDKFRAIGAGPTLVPDFKLIDTGLGPEYERFSPDADWMPNVVLIAKNVYVWLEQLSKKYHRAITKLDEIPDEELDILARWGFTALWLIGLWERSPASQKIKQICGNPEAISSAYSLYDYTIAEDLGGESALMNLRNRAFSHGIRLSSDMVPNHMGIYSKWVIEHPDWFIHLRHSPFPSYRFTGVNLSWDERVGIYIEDGYWNRQDAAVVFKRVDHWTGDERYIYHGNDGTHMPWNDTAQLNFLMPEVREAVIQTIIHVARQFPIIRFDAAMTLVKKHYQRLWFPQPGSGGDIPSRAEYGITKKEFDQLFPAEFWREVVDRVAAEVPDTLLLAEAFWLMEGYFVRTLGMHRVYNSAFMNMLKMEENAKYRSVIKNVLEFNPQILKRFVNFMNNPDEETTLAQFGKDDKYFGVLLMMVTMPGLPMFGHGQIEGFGEKYGMEYRRAYWDEQVDWNLVWRHESEIFPLMKKRYLFSGVENFLLYDFYNQHGYVNENVFAYSNMCGDERAIILYHNKFEQAAGWIKTSVAFSLDGKHLIQKTLAQGLKLKTDEPYYYIFKDYKTGLEYIRQGREIAQNGLYVQLDAFKYHIFMDFREIYDTPEGHYRNLTNFLNGRGVPNIEEAVTELYLKPIHIPFTAIINPDTLHKLAGGEINEFEDKIRALLWAVKHFSEGLGDVETVASHLKRVFLAALQLEKLDVPETIDFFRTYPNNKRILLIWLVVYSLGRIKAEITDYEEQSLTWIDEWLLGKIIRQTIQAMGTDDWVAYREEFLIKILIKHHQWIKNPLINILKDPEVQNYIHLNRYEGILYFHKESFEELMNWLFIVSIVHEPTGSIERYEVVRKFIQSAKKAKYQFNKMR